MNETLEGVSLQKREDGYHLLIPDQANTPLAEKIRAGNGRTKIDCVVEFGNWSGGKVGTDTGFKEPTR